MDGSSPVCLCHYCGSPYSPPPIAVDLDRNRIVVDGRDIRCEPKTAEVMSVLVDGYPKVVSPDRMIAKVWGASGGTQSPRNDLAVYLWRLRKVLKGTGWTVTKYSRGGYRLYKEDAA